MILFAVSHPATSLLHHHSFAFVSEFELELLVSFLVQKPERRKECNMTETHVINSSKSTCKLQNPPVIRVHLASEGILL